MSRSANQMLRLLIPVMRLVSLRDYVGPPPWPELRDPDDAPIWQTAVIAGAAYVVSQNLADFPPLVDGRHRSFGIEYVTAIEFIEDLLGISVISVYDAEIAQEALIRSRRNR